LKNQTSAQFNKLKEMKFENPKQSKQELKAYFERFTEEIDTAFKNLREK
jgi:V-type H+-transporting ATPase subunit A